MIFYTSDQLHLLPPRIAAEPDGLKQEQARLEELARRGEEVGKAATRKHDEYNSALQGAADLEALGQTADAEYQKCVVAAFTECTVNPAFDHDSAMAAMERHQRRRDYFRRAVEFARVYNIPKLLAESMEADAALAAALCSIKSQRALISAVERFIAGQGLLATEGVLEFSKDSGKTAALIADAADAFRSAKDLAAAVTNERSRQHGLGLGDFSTGVRNERF